MENKNIVGKAFLVVVVIGLVYLFSWFKSCATSKPLVKTKIEDKKAEIKVINRTVEVEKLKYVPIKAKSVALSEQITIYKKIHDTVRIVMFQDSLITNQRLEIKQLDSIIFFQDEEIRNYNELTEMQEIYISDLETDVKELKKQVRKGKVKGVLIGAGGIVIGVLVGVLMSK